jgi:hypothetical protein
MGNNRELEEVTAQLQSVIVQPAKQRKRLIDIRISILFGKN